MNVPLLHCTTSRAENTAKRILVAGELGILLRLRIGRMVYIGLT